MKTIRRLNREKGITIVLITHFMDEAARAGRVVVMDNGEILMDGAPHTVFSQVEELKRVGLDVPQAAELADELRREGWAPPAGYSDPWKSAWTRLHLRYRIPSCRKSQMKEKSAQKTSLRISLRNEHLNAAQNAGGRPRQHLQSLTAWLVRGFDRKAVKRAPKLFERR